MPNDFFDKELLTTSDCIHVEVTSEFLVEQSSPQENVFSFAYHISIQNRGVRSAKLLNRYWMITDGNQQIREVSGKGVIGEQPLIAPGETFHYTSGAVLETPVGHMQGHYDMISETGERFKAEIPLFRLSRPYALN